MLLKIIKEISYEDANKLKEAKAKELSLSKLEDANFLCEDLIGKEDNFQDKDQNLKNIVKDVGDFIQPEFAIVNDFFEGYVYRRVAESKKKEIILFSVGSQNLITGVEFGITYPRNLGYEFTSGSFFDRKYDYSNHIKDGLILRIANYFQDKKEIYAAISKALVKNKELYSNLTSEDFVKDLSLLFSSDYAFNTISDLDISKTNKEEIFLRRKAIRKNWIYIGKEAFCPKENIEQHWFHPELETELWLKDNKLIFYTSLAGWRSHSEETFKNQIADPEFKQFFDENLQDWLKRIILTTDFGMAICDKIKTKFLISNF